MRSFALRFAAMSVVMIRWSLQRGRGHAGRPVECAAGGVGQGDLRPEPAPRATAATSKGSPSGSSRLPNGRLPAPPHDDSGHTWHHADDILFGVAKFGLTPPYGPAAYQSDMPAFGSTLTDQQIWDALAYIKSRWSSRARDAQAQMQRRRGG